MTDQPVLTGQENPARSGIPGALARYRVMAYVVGVGLLALCAAMVLAYGFDQHQFTKLVGPIHGFLYIVYFLATVDLALKLRWSVKRAVLILLAAMIPFLSFVAERRITHEVEGTLH
jgi:integral membrane protein